MENENKVVFGIFKAREQIEQAIFDMREKGFRNADISALLPSGESTKEFAHENETKLPEGAYIGSATGILAGGALGWLAGIGSLAIPGIGPLVAVGPVMAALAGAGAGGTIGGIAGGLIGMGLPEYEAKRYEGFVKEGGYLLSVHCDNDEWTDKAENIMKANGATDVTSAFEESSDSHDRVTEDKPRTVHYPS